MFVEKNAKKKRNLFHYSLNWFLSVIIAVISLLFVAYYQKIDNSINNHLKERKSFRKSFQKYIDENISKIKKISKNKGILNNFPEKSEKIDLILNSVKDITDVSIVYIMNLEGVVVSSSILPNGQTLKGNNYRFRKYFETALEGRIELYPALGVTTNKRGLYLSSPLKKEGLIEGVIVFKLSLEKIDRYLNAEHRISLMVSENGIIFATNRNEWLFKSVKEISVETQRKLQVTRQFAQKNIKPISVDLSNEKVKIDNVNYNVNLFNLPVSGWKIISCYNQGSEELSKIQRYVLFTIFIIILIFITLIVLLIKNIDDMKIIEKNLKDSEENLSITLNSIGDAVIVTNINGEIVRMNPVAEKLSHVKFSDVKNRKLIEAFNIINAKTRKPVANPVDKVLETGETIGLSNHTILVAKNGKEYQIADSAAPILNDSKIIIGVVLVFRDVSEEYRLQKQVLISEERYREIAKTNWVWEIDENVRYTYCSENVIDILGYEVHEVLGKTPFDFMAEESLKEDKIKFEKILVNKSKIVDFENLNIKKNGEEIWLLTNGIPFYDGNGKLLGYRGSDKDITERVIQEKEVFRLRNYLSNIIDSMPSVIIGVDRECKVTQWNKTAETRTGISSQKACGKMLTEVFPELVLQKDKIYESIKTREIRIEEKITVTRDEKIYYEDITIYPLITDGVNGAVIRIDDVTSKVKMEEMMIQSEKMLSVGGLAAGMAHEINNPLAGIMQTAEVLANRLDCDQEIPANLKAAEKTGIELKSIRDYMELRDVPRMLKTIKDSGSRVAVIVDNMLNFSRKNDMKISYENFEDLMNTTLQLANTDYDLKKRYDFKRINISRDYGENLPLIPCERAKIQQVLLNIFRNGAQEMLKSNNEEPNLIIKMYCENDYLCIEIEDNGPGMDEETRKRIFEPFFTTKKVGEGTGLGLSVSYFIIKENHFGEMFVDSTPGKGTKFTIHLPLKIADLEKDSE